MFVTIWMCTHEWSLISMRATAFTFATCHQPLIWSSLLTRSTTVRSFLFARTGRRMRICLTASAGVRRVSRSASAEAGASIRSRVSGSSVVSSSDMRDTIRHRARRHLEWARRQPAGFWRRLAGSIIDSIVVGVVTYALEAVVSQTVGVLLGLVVSAAYFT